eukprot:TRINITY_DN853_c1_g1_i1.p1 TRINITY_DN853_c1_g1~~TRINITY_DN853_c1_g1_i1.p1  ORF type:complete len:140 (+),score=2.62 TRINITY_DN853_c1_g1_i1:56-475(+)
MRGSRLTLNFKKCRIVYCFIRVSGLKLQIQILFPILFTTEASMNHKRTEEAWSVQRHKKLTSVRVIAFSGFQANDIHSQACDIHFELTASISLKLMACPVLLMALEVALQHFHLNRQAALVDSILRTALINSRNLHLPM